MFTNKVAATRVINAIFATPDRQKVIPLRTGQKKNRLAESSSRKVLASTVRAASSRIVLPAPRNLKLKRKGKLRQKPRLLRCVERLEKRMKLPPARGRIVTEGCLPLAREMLKEKLRSSEAFSGTPRTVHAPGRKK